MQTYEEIMEFNDYDWVLEQEVGSNILEELYYRGEHFSIKLDDLASGCDW